jgi:putative drug exporter of the RND superfamily
MRSVQPLNETSVNPGFFARLGRLVVRWPLVVIGCWIAVAAALALGVPSLSQMSQEHPVAILPDDAPTTVTAKAMTEAYHDSGSENVLLIVLTDEKGLSPQDEDTYRRLTDNVRADTHNVVTLQDFLTTPPLREVVTSKDNKAWYLPVSLVGALGSPEGIEAYQHVAQTVRASAAGSTLTAYLTGPAATVADLGAVTERDVKLIELATAVMVILILLVIYRNPITMLLPLLTIAVSLVIAQGAVAAVSKFTGLGISNQTIVLMSGIMVGAGTDYAVFLISRYHDYLRQGLPSHLAVVTALTSIGKVIAASAATVAVTFLGMVFAHLGVFSTGGPALAISISVAFLAAVTLLPAILALAGPRGWIKPRRELTSRFWRRSGIRVVRRPKVHLVASLLVLGVLASCAGLARFSYDDRKTLPGSVDSALGYAAMDRHFPLNSTIPQYLFINSPHDLRTPQALADLEQMAQRISQMPDIAMVRGITRPAGVPLEQTKLSYQAGEVGAKLGDASDQISDHSVDLDQLSHGADALAGGLGDVRNQVVSAVVSVRGLVDALTSAQNELGGDKTLNDVDDAAKLVTAMRDLGDAVGGNLANVDDDITWADPVLRALDTSPICAVSPSCTGTREDLRGLVQSRDNGTLGEIAQLAQRLQETQGAQRLDTTVAGLRDALDRSQTALQSMGLDKPGVMEQRLATMQSGANTLAEASRKLADGVQQLVDQTKRMGSGMNDASSVLLAMKYNAATPSMSGFYIPPQALNQEEFKKAASVFVSPDGHSVRYLIQTNLNPFSTQAMDQVNAITDTAHGAQPNTTLSDASVSMSGFSPTLRDTRDYYTHDIKLIVAVTVTVVLLILMSLLRAIVAPLYLMASVIVSYLSALGIGVVVFQVVLGQDLHWSIPGLTFVLLVAVGADYNLLLISRIRDEAQRGVRLGVMRTVASTGGVITAAGLIFAASMFGLVFASISTLVQAGFVIGIGLLLDTFLVRTITVPAIAALLGNANWWPARLPPAADTADRPVKAEGEAPVPTTNTDDLVSDEPEQEHDESLPIYEALLAATLRR